MGCVLLSNWDSICQNFSQEDNTPLSFYIKDFALPDFQIDFLDEPQPLKVEMIYLKVPNYFRSGEKRFLLIFIDFDVKYCI
jgi:hypothetical protein